MLKKMSGSLMVGITLLSSFLYSAAPSIWLSIGTEKQNDVGSISIPIVGLLVAGIFIMIFKRISGKKIHFGFKNWKKYKIEIFILFVPIVITILANVFTSISLTAIFNELPTGQVIVGLVGSLIGALMVGFIEETIMRGGMCSILTSLFDKSRYQIVLAALVSSIMFGSLHLLNLLGGADFLYTLYQVLYASAIGVCFSVFYLKTGSLLIPILAHCLIDWSDFFFNMTGQPDMETIWYVPVLLIVLYIVVAFVLFKKFSKTIIN